jgi:hypothetical protein
VAGAILQGLRRENVCKITYRVSSLTRRKQPGYCAAGVGWGGSGCGGGTGSGAGQQLQAQGGQLWPATQAGQAQAQPPPEPPPPGGGALSCMQVPVGQGVVMHSIPSSIQPQ